MHTTNCNLVIRGARVAALPLLLCLIFSVSFEGDTKGGPMPVRQIDVTAIGFKMAYFEPDRKFFKDLTFGTFMAADPQSKLIMLSESVAVLYATRPHDGVPQHKPDCLQAFFIDVSKGSLIRKQEWLVMTRRLTSDRFDSEGRILPLEGGRYLVVAGHSIRVYTADGELMSTKILSVGISAVKAVSEGELVFLRESAWPETDRITYEWLDGRTLETQYRFEDLDAIRNQMPYSAAADSVTFAMRDGLHEVMPDGIDRVICSDPICRFPNDVGANWEIIRDGARERLVFASAQGLFVASFPGGQSWSRLTGYPGTGPELLYIAMASISQRGNRWVLLLNGKNRTFDDVRLKKGWIYFVYDVNARHPVLVVPQLQVHGDVHEALSPNGTKFLAFDGKTLRVYDVP